MDAKEIKKQLHVNDQLSKTYMEQLMKFEKSKIVPAAGLYDSDFFNALDVQSLDEDDAEWTNQNVKIFSGLYGLLRPFDEIAPLGLPLTLSTKLTTSKGKYLHSFWHDPIVHELNEHFRKMPMPVVINLAKEEDSGKILEGDLPKDMQVITVGFRQVDDAGTAKGEFLRWALVNRCMTVEDLLEYQGDIDEEAGEEPIYRVSTKDQSDNKILFEEVKRKNSVQDQFRESGLSKKKFIKQESSGKNRYKRGEMEKAMEKDKKRSRAKSAVY